MKKTAIFRHFPSVCLMPMPQRMTKRCRKEWKKRKGWREKTSDYAFKVILSLGKRRGLESEFGNNAKFAPDAC